MPGERQQRSRGHPVGGTQFTAAARATAPALSPRPRSAPLAEEQHLQEMRRRRRPDLAVPTPAELYPNPATYTNSPARRVGARPRQKLSGDNHLQRAAVLNSTMAQNLATMRVDQTPYELNSMAAGFENTYQTPYAMRSDGSPMNYSPISSASHAQNPASAPTHRLDYDALDHENGPCVPDSDDATDNELIYSDFNTIDPNKPIPDDTDFFDPFQGTPLNHSDQTAQNFIWPQGGYGGGGGGGASTLHYMP